MLKSEAKPAPIDQTFTFAPHMPITIEGDVKDPDELMRKLQPMMQGQLNDFARQMEDNASGRALPSAYRYLRLSRGLPA